MNEMNDAHAYEMQVQKWKPNTWGVTKHVKETTLEALKIALVSVLGEHGLYIGNLRGQGYDGAPNMRGEFNGL
jgi:hypothetical protein